LVGVDRTRFGSLSARSESKTIKAFCRSALFCTALHDRCVDRLLLMPSSEHHLPSLPMAFFIEPAKASVGEASAILANRARSQASGLLPRNV